MKMAVSFLIPISGHLGTLAVVVRNEFGRTLGHCGMKLGRLRQSLIRGFLGELSDLGIAVDLG
jgi:hypothetical protein